MGIKVQKGDTYFGSGRAVGFAAADGGIKKTVYKNERPDSRPQEILCLIVFGRSSLGVLLELRIRAENAAARCERIMSKTLCFIVCMSYFYVF